MSQHVDGDRNKLKGLLFFMAFSMIAVAVYADSSVTDSDAASLSSLLEEAKARNPRIEAAKAKWQAARSRIPQASALPDPMAGYMIMGDMIETSLGPQEDVFEVEQMIPFPGKLWQRRQQAMAEAKAQEALWRATEQDVVQQVSKAYYDLYALDATIDVIEELKGLLQKFEEIAQSRYASNSGAQRDVAKAQVEVSSVLEKLYMLNQQRQTTEALLNTLLNRDSMRLVGGTQPLALPRISQNLDELLIQAANGRPELKEAQAMLQSESHGKKLAAMEYAPDISVGFQYVRIGNGTTTMADDGRDAWMVPIKVTIPLWQNRIIPSVIEAKRNFSAAQALLAQEENSTEYAVKDAYYRFVSTSKIVSLYENALIPEAELAFKSDQAGYESSQVDVLNLIDSERVYLNAKMMHYQNLAEALKSFADLERAVGESIQTMDASSYGQKSTGAI